MVVACERSSAPTLQLRVQSVRRWRAQGHRHRRSCERERARCGCRDSAFRWHCPKERPGDHGFDGRRLRRDAHASWLGGRVAWGDGCRGPDRWHDWAFRRPRAFAALRPPRRSDGVERAGVSGSARVPSAACGAESRADSYAGPCAGPCARSGSCTHYGFDSRTSAGACAGGDDDDDDVCGATVTRRNARDSTGDDDLDTGRRATELCAGAGHAANLGPANLGPGGAGDPRGANRVGARSSHDGGVAESRAEVTHSGCGCVRRPDPVTQAARTASRANGCWQLSRAWQRRSGCPKAPSDVGSPRGSTRFPTVVRGRTRFTRRGFPGSID